MADQTGEVTALLRRWQTGDAEAEARLFELVLPDLRRLAQYFMRRERAGHTLQPSALLNETYLRLVRARDQDWQNRRHFFAVAAMAMRRYLVDYARSRPRAKFEPLDRLSGKLAPQRSSIDTAIAVGGLLDELRTIAPEQATIVELRFFVGFTEQETAQALDLPLRSMQRSWHEAREWLYRRLNEQV